MQRRKLNARLPEDVHTAVADVAGVYGLSMNDVMVMALRSFTGYVAKHQRLPGSPAPVAATRPPKVKPGRNDRCHCGSGRKYKQCCYPA